MSRLAHEGWEVVTERDDVVGAIGPHSLVHATRLEGAVKTVSDWQVSLHVEGEPHLNEERVSIPADVDIWEWIDGQLDEMAADTPQA